MGADQRRPRRAALDARRVAVRAVGADGARALVDQRGQGQAHRLFLFQDCLKKNVICEWSSEDEAKDLEEVEEWLSGQEFTEDESIYCIGDGVTVDLMTGDDELKPIV